MKPLCTRILVPGLGLTAALAQGVEWNDAQIDSSQEAVTISVEADQPSLPPTEQQLRRRLRESLGRPVDTPQERLLGDGTLEITTRVARFCARPSLVQSQTGVGGNVTVAAPCTQF